MALTKKREEYVKVKVGKGQLVKVPHEDTGRFAEEGEIVEVPISAAKGFELADSTKEIVPVSYADMKLNELRKLAQENGLDDKGSSDDLIDRLKKADVKPVGFKAADKKEK